MPELKAGDHATYRALVGGHEYDATVVLSRADGRVDIELDKRHTGYGDVVTLTRIPVVPARADLVGGTCCAGASL